MLVNLNAILADAQKNRYAVGLFNTTDTDMLEAVIAAAEECRSPVIIGTAEVLLPNGELKLIAPSIIAAAKRASVPVVVHYDHGLTFDRCMEALRLGFSSVMFDGSASPYDENIRATAEIVKIAHALGATVEGEIGHVGQGADGDNKSKGKPDGDDKKDNKDDGANDKDPGKDDDNKDQEKPEDDKKDDKKEDAADEGDEKQPTPEEKEIEAVLKKAQERNDEHEAQKRARARKARLPPNERDW